MKSCSPLWGPVGRSVCLCVDGPPLFLYFLLNLSSPSSVSSQGIVKPLLLCFILLFLLNVFFLIIPLYTSLLCIRVQFLKDSSDIFFFLTCESHCVFVTEGWSYFSVFSTRSSASHTHISTHSNITQPPLLYLCWYFVNNKRSEKKTQNACKASLVGGP